MYHQNETDETLVLLTLAGNQQAYEHLVKRYQKAVVASALSITKSQFMAEDAAQDAFVTAWMKLNVLQEPKKYGSWVCRIAKNCALNMITRYRSFIPLDLVDNMDIFDDVTQNPMELYTLSEEKSEVNKSMEKLPERVREIIYLHYFEELSIAEIADRMRISEGTVKWQLHDGRKRIRKELCAMNEKYSDTLVQRVMKKVEELKLWQFKNDKSGFEKIYKEVLSEVEELPECKEKQYALADVLMRGWWWLPGDKNDALFARIASAAMEGKNEEVMTFIVSREDSRLSGDARIEFIRDKQIPRLEKAGFPKTLGREWFWLGYNLFRKGRAEEGNSAYDQAEAVLQKGDLYHAFVPFARKMENALLQDYQGKDLNHYRFSASVEEYRYIGGTPRYWDKQSYAEGYMNSIDREISNIFCNSSRCDGQFFADISIGETYVGSDGSTLSYVSDNETVETPVGRFENCQLWVTKIWGWGGKSVFRSYYKEGIGIVRHEHTKDSLTEVCALKAYRVNGKGLLPFEAGNTWEYDFGYHAEIMESALTFTVAFANTERVLLASLQNRTRLKYDENSWVEMIGQIRSEYYEEKGNSEFICDVSLPIARAEALAVTPMEKAHTKAAASVMRRIMETDPVFNPHHTAKGHWNFFSKNFVQKKKDQLYFGHDYRWSFEWKNTANLGSGKAILYNDIYGILKDATNCLWSDEWQIGASPVIEYTKWDRTVKTKILCENGGTVTTKAGTFENCLKLSLDIGGMTDGWSYRGGKKIYYFAKGVGIVKTENESRGKTAVYELTSYDGVGEGYMPMSDGMIRRYDAIDLTDGYVSGVEYTYVADEDGDMVIFADRMGIRMLSLPVTQYSAIQGEIIEDLLWGENKWQEGHLKYAANHFHILLHMMERPSRNRMNAKRSVELQDFYMKVMELLGKDGEVPSAWYEIYAWLAFIKAAALFGNKNKEEGYRTLEIVLDYCEKIKHLKKGDLLELGSEEMFAGIRLVYGENYILLPDGTKEPLEHDSSFNAHNMVWCMNAPKGWEWFNSVRNEERFKAYIERAEKIANN